MLHEVNFRYRLIIQILDVVIIVVSLFSASYLRINIALGKPGPAAAFDTPAPLFVVAGLVWWTAFQMTHEYAPHEYAGFWHALQLFVLGHVVAVLLFFGTLYMTYRDYSRLQAIYFIVVALMTTACSRVIIHRVRIYLLRDTRRHYGVLIVGTDQHAQNLGEKLLLHSRQGVRLRGYVHYGKQQSTDDQITPILGTVNELENIIQTHRISEIIITVGHHYRVDFHQLLSILQNQAVAIRLAPDYSEYAYFHVSVNDFEGFPLLGLRAPILSPSQRLIKRLFDIAISMIALTLGVPVFILIAIIIHLDSPGPVIIWQERVGQYGRPFKMLKFRSMIDGVELESNGPTIKQRDDDRITSVGHFIRRTSLDELPQFINILRGEMSLVGPRPELPERVADYQDWQRKRFEVPQGLTGWWQIKGRAELPMIENTEYDLYYISHYSLWLDLQILFRTIFVVMRGTGAY